MRRALVPKHDIKNIFRRVFIFQLCFEILGRTALHLADLFFCFENLAPRIAPDELHFFLEAVFLYACRNTGSDSHTLSKSFAGPLFEGWIFSWYLCDYLTYPVDDAISTSANSSSLM